MSAEHEPPSTERWPGPAYVRLEHRVLLTALAGGAPCPAALRITASELSGAREAAPWLAMADAHDPAQALVESRLLPPYLSAFLAPREPTAPPLATRADAVREALRPGRSYDELTFGVRVVLLGGLVGLTAQAVVNTFIAPVFDKMDPHSAHTVGGAPFFALAVVVAVVALVVRLRGRSASAVSRTSAWVQLAQLSYSSRGPRFPDEHTALRWLAAADRAQVPVHAPLRSLATTGGSALARFADAARGAATTREAWDAWIRAGLISPPLVRAGEGLLGSAVERPYDRLAGLARHAPRSRALDHERLLLAAGTIAVALGALSIMYGVYRAVFGLGGYFT